MNDDVKICILEICRGKLFLFNVQNSEIQYIDTQIRDLNSDITVEIFRSRTGKMPRSLLIELPGCQEQTWNRGH